MALNVIKWSSVLILSFPRSGLVIESSSKSSASTEKEISQVQPKVLWGEGSSGLFLASGKPLVSTLRALAADLSYSFSLVRTDTALHGLPQHRIHTFYFFWRSPTAPLLDYVLTPRPKLEDFLKAIPLWAEYQDLPVQIGKVTDGFKPYLYILLREQLDHKQFVQKMARENDGMITLSNYLDKHNLLDDCINWMNHYFPGDKFQTNQFWSNRRIVDYFEDCKDKLSKDLKYRDYSPIFMGHTFTEFNFIEARAKNVMACVHPVEDRFLNIREVMALMGMPHDLKIHNPVRGSLLIYLQ